MPRRALAFITVLVLALHWLVLRGVPLAWNPPQQPADRVFSTRSIPAAVPEHMLRAGLPGSPQESPYRHD